MEGASSVSDDIFTKYPALRGKPGEMAMLCALLRDRGLHADALAIGEAAVAAAPGILSIDTLVRGVLSKGVQPFHRSMMLDDERNRAYAAAIARVVKPGMKVLEIGCGAGLLAMLAARAGAQVTTCEANPLIAAAATQVIARNGLSDRIRVIPKRSTELMIPEDLSEPADLLIHEIFGAQLFDEGVTESVTDARKRLLKPGAPSIPPAASIRCALLHDERRRERRTLENIEGFDLSAFDLLTRSKPWLSSSPTGDIDIRSEPVTGLRMNYDREPPFGPAAETITLVSDGGRIDGVMQWIAIDLGDGAILDNRPTPDGAPSSWGVPIQRLLEPIDTMPGDLIDLTLRHRGTLLTMDAIKRPAD